MKPTESSSAPNYASTEKRYDLVERVLRLNLANGRLKPGTVLLEGPIADLLQTSRAPVSTALQSLESAGLIHAFDGRGFLVGPAKSRPAPRRIDLRQVGLEVPDEVESALQSRGAVDRICASAESAIAACLAFGEFRIAEVDLAAHFNVSRTVAREVLNRLLERGLVRKSQSSRWLAGPLTARSIRDIFELRRALEPVAMLSAARHWSRDEIARLKERADAALPATHPGNPLGSDEIEVALVACTVLKTPNLRMVEIVAQNLVPLRAANRALSKLGLPGDRVAIKEHSMVLDLLLNDAVDTAANLWLDHLQMAEGRSIARLKLVAVIPDPGTFAPYLVRVDA